MGEKNDVLCSYLEKPEVFADFINGSLFGGREELKPEELTHMPETYHAKKNLRNGETERLNRTRDVIKGISRGRRYALIAVENQDELHYAMPFRCMEYDVADYRRQLDQVRARHKKAGDLKSSAEYLSEMTAEDKLAPVTTIVFYHGSGVWNACRDLHGMIDFAGENEFLKSFTANYRMNPVTAADLKEETFRTGLREMIGLLKRSKSKEAIKSYCRENEERFRHMDEETYDLISVMLNHKKLEQYKTVVRKGKGEVDMCQALDEIMEDGIQIGISQGIQQGISQGISQGTLAKTQTAARNMYLRGMKAEDVAAICEEDIEMIKEWFVDWNKGCNGSDLAESMSFASAKR